MDPILVVSPHLDDAVFSVGQLLASWSGATVLTVFAGTPFKERITPFDVRSEFRNSTHAMISRWHEDDRALKRFNARPVRLSHLDHQYRTPEETPDVTGIISDIHRVAEAIKATKLIGPLGLRHVDHEITAKCCIEAGRVLNAELWLYEDIPSRVLWPEEVTPTIERLADQYDLSPRRGFLGEGEKRVKRGAVGCYSSQLWAPEIDPDVLFVPERLWRFK